MYHGFVKSIPYELEEASLLDGCNRPQTFFKIVLPMLSPTSVTIAILNVLWIWNDYLLPSLVLTEDRYFTMPIKMKVFNGTYMNDWELLIPALLLTILPILIAYLFGQRFIIRGVSQGAIK
ncbi:Inner membrane ABC transporter permease protein YcjP [compost metagenome]